MRRMVDTHAAIRSGWVRGGGGGGGQRVDLKEGRKLLERWIGGL